MTVETPPPQSILIIGSGVFGLSTALSLSQDAHYNNTTITLLDRSPFPSPDGSSIDSSRIIRADYSSPAYSDLAALAQKQWRKQGPNDLGGQGRYDESGLVLVANEGEQGWDYVNESYTNVANEHNKKGDHLAVVELPSRRHIEKEVGTGGGSGSWGYVNHRSGWADAEASMLWLRRKAEATRRIAFVVGEATRLIINDGKVKGVHTKTGTDIHADLTVLATGAWTPKLVDLRGRCQATGQVLAYIRLTDEEQSKLSTMPVLLNMSTGMFIISPRNNVLKVARHAYGYANPATITHPEVEGEEIEVSLPYTSWDKKEYSIPKEGMEACAKALAEMIPMLAGREFYHSRLCWYTDTPKGDFLFDYHPRYAKTLFLATGGSGHGFKFLPVIGDRIVECLKGQCPDEFKEKWAWPEKTVEQVVTEDGSRGGAPGMILSQEMEI